MTTDDLLPSSKELKLDIYMFYLGYKYLSIFLLFSKIDICLASSVQKPLAQMGISNLQSQTGTLLTFLTPSMCSLGCLHPDLQ